MSIKEILEKHRKWLTDEEGGEKANLSGADLSRANLSGADLCGLPTIIPADQVEEVQDGT